jgi:hypothetical protein
VPVGQLQAVAPRTRIAFSRGCALAISASICEVQQVVITIINRGYGTGVGRADVAGGFFHMHGHWYSSNSNALQT